MQSLNRSRQTYKLRTTVLHYCPRLWQLLFSQEFQSYRYLLFQTIKFPFIWNPSHQHMDVLQDSYLRQMNNARKPSQNKYK